MNPCLAIFTHEGAAGTVDDFMPRWKALGIPVIGCYPEGDRITGDWDDTISEGISAHAGEAVFLRFRNTCDRLLATRHDLFVIAEYDTVNLRDELPRHTAGHVSTYPITINDSPAKCLLSPWVMDRMTLAELSVAMSHELKVNRRCEESMGLLDRWLGIVCEHGEVKTIMCANALGYPWHAGAIDRIRRMGYAWVHGWKHKENFGDLWR